MHFNSHAHVERDQPFTKTHVKDLNFNSHAHVERDCVAIFTRTISSISTHTLTWSVTRVDIRSYSTLYNFNSHAHVERDKRTSFISNLFSNFNSHAHVERDAAVWFAFGRTLKFQLTRSRGAWQGKWNAPCWVFPISTHTLTWSVTFVEFSYPALIEISTHTLTWSVTQRQLSDTSAVRFQLTRSRGAWPERHWAGICKRHFNSHAHVERDERFSFRSQWNLISTHTLTWSVTI